MSVGIGRAANDLTQLLRSFQEAQLALQSATSSHKSQCVVAYEELGVMPLLLQSHDQTGLLSFMQSVLGPLMVYDHENNSELVATLWIYLANNGHMQRTAESCHIHINSLKYRMRRIAEIIKLDLHDGEVRFYLQLALSIRAALDILSDRRK